MLSVSQLSLPMRIALAATLAFAALWFVALRPKPVADPAPPAAPAGAQSAPGKAAAQAQQAAGAQAQGAEKREQAAAADGAASAAPDAQASGAATAKGAATPGGPVDVAKAAGRDVPKPAAAVLRDVAKGKVAILLFWDRKVSDDRAVRRAVAAIDRRGGKVAVHTAAMTKLAGYEAITRGVPVVTSPTVLVIDRARRARTISGLTVTSELDDVVAKAIRVRP
jgi:hypothetical protein